MQNDSVVSGTDTEDPNSKNERINDELTVRPTQHQSSTRQTRLATVNADHPSSSSTIFVTTTLKSLEFSRKPLWLENDNIINFMTTDCKIANKVGKDLMRKKMISCEKLLAQNPNIGDIIIDEVDNKLIFHLFVKLNNEERIEIDNLEKVLEILKDTMITFSIKSVSIAKTSNLIEAQYWIPITEFLKKHLCENEIKVTVCTDEVVIPNPEDREAIIRENHEALIGGHKGRDKTLKRIEERFSWKNVKSDVEQFIKYCEECQKRKLIRQTTKQPMIITSTPTKAFERVDLDIVGELHPPTRSGNKNILTWQCNLTKYSGAIPLSKVDSPNIAKAFAEDFICRFGCPTTICTDQGANLISDLVHQFTRIFKIEQFKSTAFHPQTMGSLERSHHTLIEYLKYYTNRENWDEYLKYAIFSYNTSVHEATGFSPHELVFGTAARIPTEFADEMVERTYNGMLDDLLSKLTDSQALAGARLVIAKERSKRLYDQKLKIANFKVGDLVYMLNEGDKSKFKNHYVGPYRIMRIFENYNVEIDMGDGKVKTVHANRLKLACIRPT